jgi:hypothetical protein
MDDPCPEQLPMEREGLEPMAEVSVQMSSGETFASQPVLAQGLNGEVEPMVCRAS